MEKRKKGGSRENEKTPLYVFEDPLQGSVGPPNPSCP